MAIFSKKFLSRVSFAVITSLVGGVICNAIWGYIDNIPFRKALSIESILWVAVPLLIFILGWLWIKSIFTYLNRLLVIIQQTGTIFLDEVISDAQDEQNFSLRIKPLIDKILQMCVAITDVKPIFVNKEAQSWGGIFSHRGSALVLTNLYDPKGISKLKIGQQINSRNYIASWVLPQQAERTVDKNNDRGMELYGSNVVLVRALRERERVEIRENQALDIRSGIAVRLQYQKDIVGVLVLGSPRENYYAKEDVFPAWIMSQILTSAHIHLICYCPWHRNGWRDYRQQSNIKAQEFTFYADDYRRSEMLDKNISDKSPTAEIANDYRLLCDRIAATDPIDKVYLIGNFNGWNETINPMTKDTTEQKWRIVLNLPKGEYWYQYKIIQSSGAEYIFDPKTPLWPDYYGKVIQSVLKLD